MLSKTAGADGLRGAGRPGTRVARRASDSSVLERAMDDPGWLSSPACESASTRICHFRALYRQFTPFQQGLLARRPIQVVERTDFVSRRGLGDTGRRESELDPLPKWVGPIPAAR